MVRVLVIDDDPIYLDELTVGLRDYQHEVTTAASAPEALAVFEPGKFDIAICDMIMSGGGALTFLHDVRAQDDSFPIIVVTGRSAIATSPLFTDGMRDADAKIEKHMPMRDIHQLIKNLT